MNTGTIIGIAAGAILIGIIILYNSLVRLKNHVKNAFSQIDVQLKRRNDLIPKLVDTVKGYMKHERSVLEGVTKARTMMMNAGSVSEKADASNMLTDTLKSLFAVAENYPDLKASKNFLELQDEITTTENRIAYARQHYNDLVTMFNTKIEVFPNSIIAKMLKFTKAELWKADESDKKDIKVNT